MALSVAPTQGELKSERATECWLWKLNWMMSPSAAVMLSGVKTDETWTSIVAARADVARARIEAADFIVENCSCRCDVSTNK